MNNVEGPSSRLLSVRPSGFTPVRRPERTKSNGTLESAPNACWTTARCNRLLRPISSRLLLLRKRKPSTVGIYGSTSEQEQTTDLPNLQSAKRSESRAWVSSATSLDRRHPEWEPEEQPRKRLRRTYSSKGGLWIGRHNASERAEPGNLSVQLPSPMISRTVPGDYLLEIDDISQEGFRDARENLDTSNADDRLTSKVNPRDTFRRLIKAVAPSQWMVYDGLYNAVQTLLTSTAKTRLEAMLARPSLFSTCLRRVPAYITKEQAIAKQENPDDPEDVVSFMYNELEGFPRSTTSMQEVVRAHGVLMLCEAIEERFILPSIARYLVGLCLQHAAFREAESLVKSMILIMGTIHEPRSTVDQLFSQAINPALQALREISRQSGQNKLLFGQLAELLDRDIIPISWISSRDMVGVWNEVLRAISQNQHDTPEAMELIRVTMKRLYSRTGYDTTNLIQRERRICQKIATNRVMRLRSLPHLPCEQEDTGNDSVATMSNILTVLLSAIYSNSLPSDIRNGCHVNATFSSQLLRYLAIDSFQVIRFMRQEEFDSATLSARASTIFLPTLALKICLSSKDQAVDDLHSFGPSLPNSESLKKHLLDSFPTLLCSMAHCCSRVTLSSSFKIMEHMTSRLQTLTSPLFSQFAVSAAFEFAETTMRQEHINWALRVEEACEGGIEGLGGTSARSPKVIKTNEDKPAASFRWEDSICEWVACTPAPIKAKARAVKAPKRKISDSPEEDTPGSQLIPIAEGLDPKSRSQLPEVSFLPASLPAWEPESLVVIPRTRSHSCGGNEDSDGAGPVPFEEARWGLDSSFFSQQRRSKRLRFSNPPNLQLGLQQNYHSHKLSAPESTSEEEIGPLPTDSGRRRVRIEVRIPSSCPSSNNSNLGSRNSIFSPPFPCGRPITQHKSFEIRIPSHPPPPGSPAQDREELKDITNRPALNLNPTKKQSLKPDRKSLNAEGVDHRGLKIGSRPLRTRPRAKRFAGARSSAQQRSSTQPGGGNLEGQDLGEMAGELTGESEDELAF